LKLCLTFCSLSQTPAGTRIAPGAS
jgi:hypothetical protein